MASAQIFLILLFSKEQIIYFQYSKAAVTDMIFAASATPTLQQWMGFARITANTLLLKIKIDFNYT